MAFAQPLALWFLLLFVPIVLLYLLKQRRRRVQVSTLLFWDQILRDEHSVTSMAKLRKLLSLLLQLLIVTLLALALARPVFSKDLLGARRVVVMLDTSASMTAVEDESPRFDRARELAADVFRGMSIGDTGMLVTVSQEPDIRAAFTDSRKELLDVLDTVEPTHGTTNFADAMALLNNLPPDERDTLVYLITDGAFDPVAFEPPERCTFAYMPVGDAKDNIGITAFQLRPLPASPRDFEILFEVVNHTDSDRTVPYEVAVGGLLIDAGEMAIKRGEVQTQTVRQFSQTGGEVEVTVDYDDAFDTDNHAYAVLPAPRPLPVVLVTEGNLFLETALLTDEEIELATVAPGELDGILADWHHPLDETVFIFDRCLPGEVAYRNAVFIDRWPESLGPRIVGDLTDPLVADWDRDHPINRHLHLMNIRIQQAVQVEADAGWTALISGVEHPLVLYREDADQKTALLAFDTTSSDLPLRVAFPILIANAVRHMSGTGDGAPWASRPMGSLLTYNDLAEVFEQQHAGDHEAGDDGGFAVLGPQDEAPNFEGDGAFDDLRFAGEDLLAIQQAGVYSAVDAEGHRVPLFAAGLNDRRESDIAPAEAFPIESANPLPTIDEGLRLGTEPWLLLATIAVAVLAGEWFLFHRRWVE